MDASGGGVIRNGLHTVVRGFLLGVGFSVAIGGFYFLTLQWFMSYGSKMTSISEATMSGEVSSKDIILSDVEEQKRGGSTSIIGVVKNSGKQPARALHIQANFFSHGKFVDQYSTYLSGTLGAGSSQYFKISCGCKDTTPAEHDSFKVEIVSGF